MKEENTKRKNVKRYAAKCLMTIYIDAQNKNEAYDKLFNSDRALLEDVELIYEETLSFDKLKKGEVYLNS